MPHVEKVSIALTPEMVAVVRQAVESGEYASNSEIVREALRDWKSKRALQQQEVEELRRLWHEGLHSGPQPVCSAGRPQGRSPPSSRNPEFARGVKRYAPHSENGAGG